MDFHGNVPYCYANSLSMALSARGDHVRPGVIEVLTGVGLGALRVSDTEFYFGAPDPVQGLVKALELLGCAHTALSGPEDVPVRELLRKDLATGPVLLGPLDMGHLVYIPWREQVPGADHYVLAYRMDDEGVFVHDPAGFPAAKLTFAELEPAWRAERVGYPHGVFQRWREIRRERERPQSQVRAEAMAYFASIYRENPGAGDLIRGLAEQVGSDSMTPALGGFLTAFAFPLGARRALDYANFFGPFHEEAAGEKAAQAELFGRCQQAGNRGQWSEVSERLLALADREDRLEKTLLD